MPAQQPAFPDGPPTWPPRFPQLADVFAGMLASGDWGKYHAEHSEQLEQAISRLVEQTHTRLTSSGTIAVELALRGVGIGPGDEVIMGGYDFPGNFRCVENCQATPVLVDVSEYTGCLKAESLPATISNRTRAILVSHLHSGMAPMQAIVDLASDHGIAVIEDACQSPGALVDGKPAGSWGDVTTLSFGGSKLLTAGRGGAVASRRDDIMQRIRVFADRGNDAFPLSQIQAAIINVQLDGLARMNETRRTSVRQMMELVDDSKLKIIGTPPDERTQASYYKVLLLLNNTLHRETWIRRMQEEGVAVDTGFRGFAKRSRNRCRKVGDLLISQRFAEQGVVLHHPILLDDSATIGKLCDTINRISNSRDVHSAE